TLTPPVEVIRDKTKSGPCRACGRRVEVDARMCPFCGKASPNPSEQSRWAGRGLLLGAVLGGLVSALYCYIEYRNGTAILGGLVGALGGAIVGLVGGVIFGFVKKLRSGEE